MPWADSRLFTFVLGFLAPLCRASRRHARQAGTDDGGGGGDPKREGEREREWKRDDDHSIAFDIEAADGSRHTVS